MARGHGVRLKDDRAKTGSVYCRPWKQLFKRTDSNFGGAALLRGGCPSTSFSALQRLLTTVSRPSTVCGRWEHRIVLVAEHHAVGARCGAVYGSLGSPVQVSLSITGRRAAPIFDVHGAVGFYSHSPPQRGQTFPRMTQTSIPSASHAGHLTLGIWTAQSGQPTISTRSSPVIHPGTLSQFSMSG